MTENTLAAEVAQAVDAVASDAPETAAPVAETTPAETPGTAAPEAGDEGDDKRRNRRSAQERIAQLTRQKRELEEQVTQLRGNASKPPKYEDFPDPDEFDRAKAKHAAREALADERASLVEVEDRRIAEVVRADWQASVSAFKANAPDFEAVVYNPNLPITQPMAEALMMMGDEGAAVAYHIAKNPAEAARLAALPLTLASIEMGRMAVTLRQPPRRVVSSAPPPVSPLTGSAGDPANDPSKMSQAQYNAWRRAGR